MSDTDMHCGCCVNYMKWHHHTTTLFTYNSIIFVCTEIMIETCLKYKVERRLKVRFFNRYDMKYFGIWSSGNLVFSDKI
jgi:hypothetical protein